MKITQLLFSILVIIGSVEAQQSDLNSFKGRWLTPPGGDASTVLNFTDSNKLYFSMGRTYKWQGNYNYRIEKSNTALVITLRSDDINRKDSFQIMLTRINEEEYKLNNILHLYDDGRPPESELLENNLYILKRVKNN
jgi:hypothetical protein